MTAAAPHAQVYHAIRAEIARLGRRDDSALWRRINRSLRFREWWWYNLYHHPHTPERNLRPEYDRLGWRRSAADLRAWQRGETGYPLVDAGMRELWITGCAL
jgi:deoxyribodipyrimidine photo-lyase